MGEPLLWHDLALQPHGFTRHSDRQGRSTTLARLASKPVLGNANVPPQLGLGPHLLGQSGKASRRRRRNATCMACGGKVVAASAGMAVSHVPACGPACKRSSAWANNMRSHSIWGFDSTSHGIASRVATRPCLFRPLLARVGPPRPRATWDNPSTLRPAGVAWPQPLRGPHLPASGAWVAFAQAAVLCAQLIVNRGHPVRLGVRRCPAPRPYIAQMASSCIRAYVADSDGGIVRIAWLARGGVHISSRQVVQKLPCAWVLLPMLAQMARRPRWASGLSPRAGMSSAAMAPVLPRFEAIPQWAAIVPATSSSNAARARAGLVMM